MDNLFSSLKSLLPTLDPKRHHPLFPYTTLKIGGPADIFVPAQNIDQFISIVKLVHQLIDQKLLSSDQFLILGHGSNLLISDYGFPGLVVQNSASEIDFLPNSQVRASSGTPLSKLITATLDHQLTGLENFAYIPATVGGAIYSHIHGVSQTQFSDFLDSIDVFDLNSGRRTTILPSRYRWGYDLSPFQTNPNLIILSAIFNLKSQDSTTAQKTCQTIISQKSAVQPPNSAGCVFKNPPNLSAGQIIDQLGWKGKTVGQAQVSPTHANFIVNLGGATAQNYLDLARAVQTDVFQKRGIKLEFEIKLIGRFD